MWYFVPSVFKKSQKNEVANQAHPFFELYVLDIVH